MKATLRDANDQPLTSWTFDPAHRPAVARR